MMTEHKAASVVRSKADSEADPINAAHAEQQRQNIK
jgi:hypothetical protein